MSPHQISPHHPLVSIGGVENHAMLEEARLTEKERVLNGFHTKNPNDPRIPATIGHVCTAVYELLSDVGGYVVWRRLHWDLTMAFTNEFISRVNEHLCASWAHASQISFGKDMEKNISQAQFDALRKVAIEVAQHEYLSEKKLHVRNLLLSMAGGYDREDIESTLQDIKENECRYPWGNPEVDFQDDLEKSMKDGLTLQSARQLVGFCCWEDDYAWEYMLRAYKRWGAQQRKYLIDVLEHIDEGCDFDLIYNCFENAFNNPFLKDMLPWNMSLLSRLKSKSIGEIFWEPREKKCGFPRKRKLDMALTIKVIRAFIEQGKKERVKEIFEYWISNGQEEWAMRILKSLRNRKLSTEILGERSGGLKE